MRWITGASLLLVALAAPVAAQGAAGNAVEAQPAAVDVSRLPVDVNRIHRELRQAASREERDGLKLRYFVEVYGQAPPLVIFGPEADLTSEAVPYGAPTHREMVEQVTPRDYRPIPWDLNSLARWLADRVNKK